MAGRMKGPSDTGLTLRLSSRDNLITALVAKTIISEVVHLKYELMRLTMTNVIRDIDFDINTKIFRKSHMIVHKCNGYYHPTKSGVGRMNVGTYVRTRTHRFYLVIRNDLELCTTRQKYRRHDQRCPKDTLSGGTDHCLDFVKFRNGQPKTDPRSYL